MNCEKRAHFIHKRIQPPFQQGKQTENKLIQVLYVFLWASSKIKQKSTVCTFFCYKKQNIHSNTYTWNMTCDVPHVEADLWL